MRFGIIFGRTHGDKIVVVDGPGIPDDINKNFKEFSLEKEHGDYAEMFFHEIHLSQGRKRISFAEPQVETEAGESLDDLTIEQLKTLADGEGADLTGATVKADIISRIRDFRSLNEKTVPDLKQLASEENVEIDSHAKKAEVVNTILAHRRAAGSTT